MQIGLVVSSTRDPPQDVYSLEGIFDPQRAVNKNVVV